MGFGMETIANSNAYLYGLPSSATDTLQIDDLLDFSTTQDPAGFEPAAANGGDNGAPPAHHHFHQMMPMLYSSNSSANPNANATSAAAGNCGGLVDGSNGSFMGSDHLPAFPEDLYMPSEEAAELEWLSKFVEDSFSDMPFPSPAAAMGNFSNVNPPATTTADDNNRNTNTNNRNGNTSHLHNNHNSVPGRARSKRSRAPGQAPSIHLAATTTTRWSSLPPQLCTSTSSSSSSSSETKQRDGGGHGAKKKESMMGTGGPAMESGGGGGDGGVRRCTHCSSEKTPQWRTGPLGPKTLCNACGVRYKSGRLVPEYRPAASPTFVLTQHSNSHRKVIELRRQKDLIFRHQTQNQHHRESSPSTTTTNGTTASTTRPDLLLRDYEVC